MRRSFRFLVALISVSIVIGFSTAIANHETTNFEVRDAVNAEWYVDVDRGIPLRGSAGETSLTSHLFSPNGQLAVFLTRKGSVVSNTTEYVLHLATLSKNGRHIVHQELIRLISDSNSPAISSVRWLSNDRIGFLGQESDRPPQIMSVNLNGKLTRHTNFSGEHKLGFDVSDNKTVVFGVVLPPKSTPPPGAVGPGYIVQSETLSDIIGIDKIEGYRPTFYYVSNKRGVRQLAGVQSQYSFSAPFISVSPMGRFAVVATAPMQVPLQWAELPLATKAVKDAKVHWFHFELALIDLEENHRYALSGAPPAFPLNKVQIAWDERNERLFVFDQYLASAQAAHLSGADPQAPASFEVSLKTKQPTRLIDVSTVPVSYADPEIQIARANFDAKSKILTIQRGNTVLHYRDSLNGWRRVQVNNNAVSVSKPSFSLAVDQYVNRPAQMFATILQTSKRIPISEINTDIEDKFNPTSVYEWTDAANRKWSAGLILPANVQPGSALPLIIQTHAFSLNEFVITGPRGASAGFSAQALASAGFAVLNVGELRKGLAGSQEEFEVMSEGFRSAIVALAADRVIDPQKVGVVAWSRSGLWLQHALAFRGDLFNAAVVSDAGTFGKFSYLWLENWPSVFQDDFITQNGVPPFGEGIDVWQKEDPVTHVKAFDVPLRLNDFDRGHPVWWEAYVAMKNTGEPVEYFRLPDAPHNPVQPKHQLWVQSVTVDWFRFWLMGEENTDPLDTNQYARWRKMRDDRCAWDEPKDEKPSYCEYSNAVH